MKTSELVVFIGTVLCAFSAGVLIGMQYSKKAQEICTYSLNAYPADSVTYYRLGCHVEGFED